MRFIYRYPCLTIIVLAICYLLPGISSIPLLDRDEPRFARATIEMQEKEEWIIPYFNDEYRFDKPPLTYWWMRLNYEIFGQNEFSARLHSFIASLITALIIYQISLTLYQKKDNALLSAFIWLTSLQVMIHSRIAVADMILIASMAFSMWSMIKILYSKNPVKPFSKWFYLLYLSISLGFLAKGPLSIIIPILTIIITVIISYRDKELLERVKFLSKECLLGGFLFTLIVGIWGIPAIIQTQGAYFNIGFKEHIIDRGFGAFNNRTFIPGIYFLIIIIFISPWVSKLIPSIKESWRNKSSANKFLISWAASPFLIFSFYQTQLPHYILPAYISFSIMIGHLDFEKIKDKFLITVWINRIFFLFSIISLLVINFYLIKHNIDQNLIYSIWSFSLFLILLLFASELVKRNKIKFIFFVILIASLALIPAGTYIKKCHITCNAINLINKEGKEYKQFSVFSFSEPSLVWYLRNYCEFNDTEFDQDSSIAQESCIIILSKEWEINNENIKSWFKDKTFEPSYDNSKEIKERFSSQKINWIEGINLGKGKWTELAIIFND